MLWSLQDPSPVSYPSHNDNILNFSLPVCDCWDDTEKEKKPKDLKREPLDRVC